MIQTFHLDRSLLCDLSLVLLMKEVLLPLVAKCIFE